MKIEKVSEKEAKYFLEKAWEEYDNSINVDWDEKKYIFCAKESKTILGCIACIINGGACYVDEFIVSKDHRGKGVGTKLWKAVENFAKDKGCFRIIIKTHERNKSAIKFYKKQGLKVDAVLKDYHFHMEWYYMSKKVKGWKQK
ncbi:MAG: GNAT family N-acetyltransferase [Nanoarchaeota archaeon]|nr:GNAT family N-acetyltransferase [Nanoarchaeota archaeon]